MKQMKMAMQQKILGCFCRAHKETEVSDIGFTSFRIGHMLIANALCLLSSILLIEGNANCQTLPSVIAANEAALADIVPVILQTECSHTPTCINSHGVVDIKSYVNPETGELLEIGGHKTKAGLAAGKNAPRVEVVFNFQRHGQLPPGFGITLS